MRPTRLADRRARRRGAESPAPPAQVSSSGHTGRRRTTSGSASSHPQPDRPAAPRQAQPPYAPAAPITTTRANPLLKDGGAPRLSLTGSGNPTPRAFLKQKFRLLRRLYASGALDSTAGRREATRYDPFLWALLYVPHYLVLDSPNALTRSGIPDSHGGITLCQFHVDLFIAGEEWAFPASTTRQDRDCYIAPRGAGKSTLVFTILPLWAAAHGHQRFIAAFSDSDDQVQKHLAKFHDNIDNNAALREDFPELCTPARRANGNAVNDNKNAYVAESGFTFEAHTIDGKIVGLVNSSNERPSLIVCDDIEPSEDKYSTAMKLKGVNRLRDKILYLNEFARVVMVGTVTMAGSIMHDMVQSVLNPGTAPEHPTPTNPHRYGALVADWIREQNFRGHYYPALSINPSDGELVSLWPEKWPVEELRPRLGTNDFMKNMQNNPVGDGDFWESGDITYTRLAGCTRTILSIDPAVTATATSDYTGLAVIRYQPANPEAAFEEVAQRLSTAALGRHPRDSALLYSRVPAESSVQGEPRTAEEFLRRAAARRGRRLPPGASQAQREAFYADLRQFIPAHLLAATSTRRSRPTSAPPGARDTAGSLFDPTFTDRDTAARQRHQQRRDNGTPGNQSWGASLSPPESISAPTAPDELLPPGPHPRCEVAWANRVKMRPHKLKLYVLSILERFPEIDTILIETNQGHDFVSDPFLELPVHVQVKTQSEPKDTRIARLAGYYKHLDPRVVHADKFVPLEEEQLAYPQTANDDTVDAASTGCHFFLYKDPKRKQKRAAPRVEQRAYAGTANYRRTA
jgi:hypothetical protein